MRIIRTEELTAVTGAVNPHLVTITTNPGGVVNKSIRKNPNTDLHLQDDRQAGLKRLVRTVYQILPL